MWLPGFEHWPLAGVPGVPYDEHDDPKAMWHSTEGSSVEGAVSAYRAYPPHLIVDPWRRRKVQHIDLNYGAYALWNSDADDSRCVQIEVVGFSAEARTWPEIVLQWLGEEVARPLHEHFGVPYVVVPQGFKAPGEVNFVLASASSPLRLTQGQLDSFSGHLAHQHSPGDDHWDVPLRIERVLHYAQANTRGDNDMPILIKARGRSEVYAISSDANGAGRRHIGEREFNVLSAAGVTVTEVNPWDLDAFPERPVSSTLTAKEVWDYEIPNGRRYPGETPDEWTDAFQEAHRVVGNIAHETLPAENGS